MDTSVTSLDGSSGGKTHRVNVQKKKVTNLSLSSISVTSLHSTSSNSGDRLTTHSPNPSRTRLGLSNIRKLFTGGNNAARKGGQRKISLSVDDKKGKNQSALKCSSMQNLNNTSRDNSPVISVKNYLINSPRWVRSSSQMTVNNIKKVDSGDRKNGNKPVTTIINVQTKAKSEVNVNSTRRTVVTASPKLGKASSSQIVASFSRTMDIESPSTPLYTRGKTGSQSVPCSALPTPTGTGQVINLQLPPVGCSLAAIRNNSISAVPGQQSIEITFLSSGPPLSEETPETPGVTSPTFSLGASSSTASLLSSPSTGSLNSITKIKTVATISPATVSSSHIAMTSSPSNDKCNNSEHLPSKTKSKSKDNIKNKKHLFVDTTKVANVSGEVVKTVDIMMGSPLVGTPDMGLMSPSLHSYNEAMSNPPPLQSFFSKKVRPNLKRTKSANKLDKRKLSVAEGGDNASNTTSKNQANADG